MTPLHSFDDRHRFREYHADGAQIRWVGHIGGDTAPMTLLCRTVLDHGVLRDRASLIQSVHSLHGNFACSIQDRDGRTVAFVDKIRSYPIFYSTIGQSISIGLFPQDLNGDDLDQHPLSKDSVREFAMAGYVTGNQTLREGIAQLQAGELLDAQHGQTVVESYYRFFEATDMRSHEALRQELHTVTEQVFRRLIQRLGGRPVFVPLSMGLDSRLVVCMLHALGYDNIVTFSYGRPGNCEAAGARRVARTLGVPWQFIPFTRTLGKAFYQPTTQQYLRFSHRYVSTPSMLDIYAVRTLVEQSIAPRDAVFINGQTGDFITGGHIPLVCEQSLVTRNELLDAIASRHYALWKPLLERGGRAFAYQRIQRVLDSLPETMNSTEATHAYEYWEWRNRQCLYVVQGVRSYEFFRRDWALPLWDDLYLDFWSRMPIAAKRGQTLYRAYLSEWNYAGLFRGITFPEYLQPVGLRPVNALFSLFGSRRESYRRRYLHYWQEYAHQYAIVGYREYQKLAQAHRNPVSFFSRQILRDWYGLNALSVNQN